MTSRAASETRRTAPHPTRMLQAAPFALTVLASLAFVALGLPDGLLGVAWPSMRLSFGLPIDALGALLISFTAGYVGSSFSGGRLVRGLGLGSLLATSCLATGASLMGYALAPAWWVIVGLGLVAGVGAGGIDTGINTYAATHHGPRMLNWLHACYGIGATSGPAIMTAVFAADLTWHRGYAIVAGAQLALAAAFMATWRAWPSVTVGANSSDSQPPEASIRETLRMPVARWSIALFILYTGLELAIGSWAFTVLTEGRGIAAMTAAGWTGAYWAGLTGGRLLGAVVVTRLGLVALLRLATGLLMIGLALFSSGGPAPVSLIGLVVAGAAAGPVFPSLIAATPARVGTRHAANAVGFQIAGAAIGQSLVPSTLGFVASHLGLQTLVQLLVALAVALAVVNERMIRGQTPAARRPSAPASVIADAGRDVERPRRPLEGAERAVKPTR